MKRLTCTLAALAMLIWTCPPAQAEYLGTLQRDQDWVVNVDNGTVNGSTAFTVYYLSRRGIDDIEFRTVTPNARVTLAFPKPGRGVRRIVIDVNPPRDTHMTVEIEQGGITYPVDVDMLDRCLVFDIE